MILVILSKKTTLSYYGGNSLEFGRIVAGVYIVASKTRRIFTPALMRDMLILDW